MEDYSYLFDEFLEQTNDYDPPNSEPGNFDILSNTISLLMINRYLRINNYGHDIITDQLFTKNSLHGHKMKLKEHMINISIIRYEMEQNCVSMIINTCNRKHNTTIL